MTDAKPAFHVRMLVSYSHKDARYRETMERALALLFKDGVVQKWSDQHIMAGQSLSSQIQEHMDDSHVFVFLLSPDFIASPYCMMEWQYAAELAANGKKIFRVPVILRPCAWKDMMGNDNPKALPNDGNPISLFESEDLGWNQVYDGIKEVVEHVRRTFTPNQDFIKVVEKTDFLSQSHIKLQDLFVFLRLTCQEPQSGDQLNNDNVISTRESLLTNKYALIYGPQNSGKTALIRHLFLSLVEQREPVILIDCNNLPNRPFNLIIKEAYSQQFHGDYEIWQQEERKTLVIDNLTADRRQLDFVATAKEAFDRVYVAVPTEIYVAFFRDETRLANFRPMRIEPLTHAQQERLIKRRLELSDSQIGVTDGYVDQIEDEVNSIIISDKIFPRYPFYVLSILQSHEAYMPTNMSVTSYGYCYYVLIVANLIQSGISETDDDVGAAFNFAEHLAFQTYRHQEQQLEEAFDFQAFAANYNQKFYIASSIVNRIRQPSHGLINDQGAFRTEYMYYYFLGKYLASNTPDARRIIEDMCENSHRESNYLTLLFTIHHTSDDSIIDDILVRTMCSLDHVTPASLNPGETKRFASIVAELPNDVLTKEPVAQARARERDAKGQIEANEQRVDNMRTSQDFDAPVNGIYRILKNNKIMAHVLRNKHGRLEKSKIVEVVGIIADSALRLINLILEDEEQIAKMAVFLHERNKDWSLDQIKRALEYLSFIWAMTNIDDVASAVNVREIREAVNAIVERGDNPAYDLIGYFSHLDAAPHLTKRERTKLAELLKKHDDPFVQRVLSIRTQRYMNTHRSPTPIEQSVCSLLKVKYVNRLLTHA